MTTLWDQKLDVLDTAEAHWSTSTILTVFFAAALISALFFGLGFTFGWGGTAKVSPEFTAAPATAAPGHPSAVPAEPVFAARPSIEAAGQLAYPAAVLRPTVLQQPVMEKVIGPAIPRAPQIADRKAGPAKTAAGTEDSSARFMVQVGAIGNRKDALRLVSQLRKQGFRAAIYPGKRDKFLHVQFGPFATLQQAQAMRHQVMAHGYHAMLKAAS
ncbi:MAG: SPOR domain-containing protein [Acidobacteriaceae bacterium]